MGEVTKPDYDMSVFYADKGPGVKPKMGGFTISNTGGVDASDNPSTANNPGVGQYETKQGYVKTTAFRNVVSHSFPQDGSYNIEAAMQRASSPVKKKKK